MEWYFLSLKGLSAFQYSCHTFSLRTQDLPFPSMICTLGILKCVRIKHPFYQCERYSPHTHTCNTAWCCQNGKAFFSTDTLDHPVNPGRKICWFGFLKPALLHAVSKKKKRKVSIAPHTASLQENLTGIRCNKTNHNGIILYVCDSQI